MVAREKEKEILQILANNSAKEAIKNYCDVTGSKVEDYQVGAFVKDTSKVKFNSEHFIKTFDCTLKELIENKIISISEYSILSLLSLYVDYENNELKIDDKYMTQKDIIRISGYGKPKVIAILNSLINHNLLFGQKNLKDKRENIYYLNPYVYYRGQKLDKEIKKMIDMDNNKIS